MIIWMLHENEWIDETKHHKWQRSECGWKCFNSRTHILSNNCWSVLCDWSCVDSLGLNACKWVALITGMNLFPCCGLVLFRLDETTNINAYIPYVCRWWKNTGHNEVISFDLLWITCIDVSLRYVYAYVYITKLSDWSCRWLSFVLKIKPCMSKYELV